MAPVIKKEEIKKEEEEEDDFDPDDIPPFEMEPERQWWVHMPSQRTSESENSRWYNHQGAR
jgi:hypothetical protein